MLGSSERKLIRLHASYVPNYTFELCMVLKIILNFWNKTELIESYPTNYSICFNARDYFNQLKCGVY